MKDYILDLDKLKTSDSLGLKEISQRLKKNPNDTRARKELAKSKIIFAKMADDLEAYIDDLLEDVTIPAIKLAKKMSSPENLGKLSIAPGRDLTFLIKEENRKYKVARKLLSLFSQNTKVEKYKLVKIIEPRIGQWYKRKNMSRKDYGYKKAGYDMTLKNHFTFLKRLVNKRGFTFKFNKEYVELVHLKKVL